MLWYFFFQFWIIAFSSFAKFSEAATSRVKENRKQVGFSFFFTENMIIVLLAETKRARTQDTWNPSSRSSMSKAKVLNWIGKY